jgi:hypothetical protein
MVVNIAFFNVEIEREIYMTQSDGFVVKGHEDKVCKLYKSMYSLKQALKQWNEKFYLTLISVGFSVNEADLCVYNYHGRDRVILFLYVDRHTDLWNTP